MDFHDKPVKNLVVDSSVLIKGAPIKVNNTLSIFSCEHARFKYSTL
jgi:hypothetical protein